MSSSLMYLFAAFAAVWLFLFGYLMYIANRITALQQQVDVLLEEGQQDRPAPEIEESARGSRARAERS